MLEQDSREILNSIRDSLSNTTRVQQQNAAVRDSPDHVSQGRHDSISSTGTPGSAKFSASSQQKKKTTYTVDALEQIRKTLRPYKTDSGNSAASDGQSEAVGDRTLLQQLVDAGHEEVGTVINF